MPVLVIAVVFFVIFLVMGVMGITAMVAEHRGKLFSGKWSDEPKPDEAIVHAADRSGATVWGALYGLQHPREAVFAEAAVFDVDPLHRVGRGHGAAIVVAMGEAQRVSQFMHGLDQQTVGEHVGIRRQSVEFLPQTMIGNQRSGCRPVGLPQKQRSELECRGPTA